VTGTPLDRRKAEGAPDNVTTLLLGLQRLAGNRAVTALVHRLPGEGDTPADADLASGALTGGRGSTEALHARIYGNSALAHGPGTIHLLKNFYGGEFDWHAVHDPSAQVVRDWLTFHNLREPFNVLLPPPGECELNLERTTTTAVTDLFLSDAHLAGFLRPFDRPDCGDGALACPHRAAQPARTIPGT
jgi:hypothetical protein